MISKAKLKELAAYRLPKRCDDEGVFVVEGVKMAAEATGSGVPIRCVCATADWVEAHPVAGEAEVYTVSDAELERLSLMRSPNQVWMLVGRDFRPAEGLRRSPLTLVLDRIQDPGNMGTMLRTADWYGVRRVVCSPDTVSHLNPKVVQASMGAVFRTGVEYTDLPQWLAGCGCPVYGASLAGAPLSGHDTLQGEAVLVIGNESRGISAPVLAHVTRPTLIPNLGGTAESLNAAVAAGVLMDSLLRTNRTEQS